MEQAKLDGLLAHPSTSFALKAVIEARSGHDFLNAGHDARFLNAAPVRDADQRLETTP